MTTVYERRTREFQKRLRKADADLAVLGPGSNLFYLSGFHTEPWDRHFLLFIPAEHDPTFVVPEMFENQLHNESWIDSVVTYTDTEGPIDHLVETGEKYGIENAHILFDDHLWTRFSQDLRGIFSESTFGVCGSIVEELRLTKDDKELEAIAEASRIADEVSVEIRELGNEAIGLTERELARKIERRLYDLGAQDLAFDVSVGSGPNSAHVFHFHEDRYISKGDPVLLDFGGIVNHYCADQTRMVVFDGNPPKSFERAYKAVEKALEAGIERVEPGISAETIEHACHDVLDEFGLRDAVMHRTGHGVGLTPHEPPNILDGNATLLEPGMVFSMEPGVYFEGEFGVRIEDLVAVTDDGCHRLNDSPRTWHPL